jgi:glycosyltransferase involved in cell wall biosynthesis
VEVRSLRVVGHDASRTGAPQSLLTVLRWVRDHRPGVRIHTSLVRGGPLLREFASVGPVRSPGPVGRGAASVLASAGSTSRPGSVLGAIVAERVVGRSDADVELVNTLVALDVASRRTAQRARRVVVVHELDGVAERVLPPGPGRSRALAGVERFLAAGPAVATMLIERWGVAADRVFVVPEFVADVPVDPEEVRALRRAVVAGGRRPIVLSCGEASARKGSDRFVDLIASFPDGPNAPVGVWVGGTPGSLGWSELCADREASGLGDRLVLVPSTPSARAWIEAADVVVSTAREDPYPLVVLEAATSGRPVVATDSGGVRTVLGSAGLGDLVVGQGDVLALRDRVAELLGDEVRRGRVGAQLRRTVGEDHGAAVVGPQWWSAMVEGA